MADTDADAFVDRIANDWRTANLEAQDRALCTFAERLSADPWAMGPPEIEDLRVAGFDDVAIHDAAQVVGYFNYINRVADALGVEPETFVRAWGGEG